MELTLQQQIDLMSSYQRTRGVNQEEKLAELSKDMEEVLFFMESIKRFLPYMESAWHGAGRNNCKSCGRLCGLGQRCGMCGHEN